MYTLQVYRILYVDVLSTQTQIYLPTLYCSSLAVTAHILYLMHVQLLRKTAKSDSYLAFQFYFSFSFKITFSEFICTCEFTKSSKLWLFVSYSELKVYSDCQLIEALSKENNEPLKCQSCCVLPGRCHKGVGWVGICSVEAAQLHPVAITNSENISLRQGHFGLDWIEYLIYLRIRIYPEGQHGTQKSQVGH